MKYNRIWSCSDMEFCISCRYRECSNSMQ